MATTMISIMVFTQKMLAIYKISNIIITNTNEKENYMQNRNPIVVILLSIVTFGIYSLVWLVKTKGEMVAKGADIPTAWFLIIPLVNLYWLWKYCQGVDKVTEGKMSAPVAFILFFVLSLIGMAIIQNSFNSVS